MTHDIIITIYQATKPGNTPHVPGECSSFVGVSSVSSLPEGNNIHFMLRGTGWKIEMEIQFRKLVKVELPEDVSYGEYKPYDAYDLRNYGLYGKYKSHDGSGRAVYAYCEPIRVDSRMDNGIEAAIDAAIKMGITLSIPQKDGGRTEQKAKIVAVSELYSKKLPNDWIPELD